MVTPQEIKELHYFGVGNAMTVRTSIGSKVNSNRWLQEYTTLTEGVGFVSIKGAAQIELRGVDRATFLNRMCTNKVDTLSPGRGCEGFLTNPKGRAVAYVLVFAGPESLVLHSAPGQAEKIFTHLDYFLIREKVELHDQSTAWSELLVAGRESERLLGSITGAAPPCEYLAHLEIELASGWVSIRRLQLDGPPVFLLSCETHAVRDITQRLRDAGAQASGEPAAEILRIEAGRPEYGRDISEENFPQEVARDDWAISYNKGCYVGQETIARIASHGHVNRLLVGLRFETAQVVAAGTQVITADQPVGHVTSATFSPRLGSTLALGYVRRGHHQPGSRLGSSLGPVEVVALPAQF